MIFAFPVLADTKTIYDSVLMKSILLLPGAIQGVTSVLIGHPLDTVKTRMQARGPCVSASTFTTILGIVSHEGWRSLYRGVTPPLIIMATKRSIQFALWDALCRNPFDKGSSSPSQSYLTHLSWCTNNSFVSGAIAGGAGTVIGCPLHVVKIQTQNVTRSHSRNSMTSARQIIALEGLRGFYRGFRYHLLKDVCFAGTFLGLYDTFKRLWLRFCNNSFAAFVPGATAAMITWTLLYPIDTVKTLIQARQEHLLSELFTDTRRLYRGLGATLIKVGPILGVTMVVYDVVKRQTDAWVRFYSKGTLSS
ncbi:unnamed protein product [Phytomonas sp. Hart1]|nr:unnamed protein product [Phytomonas sp. Hart1]|eukprot:CCW66721.1 unnamed protein product [Phytomonas sp. isolate Hart1]